MHGEDLWNSANIRKIKFDTSQALENKNVNIKEGEKEAAEIT